MAAKRAEQNRKIRRENLREELKSREYIRQIHSLLESDHDAGNIPQAKMKLDGYFKLLAKTLPDTKSVELTGDQDNPVAVQEVQRVIVDEAQDTDA